MGKTLKTVAIIAAAVAVAVFAPEIAPLFLSATATAATTAATVATITAIGASIALSTASMALFGPKIPKTQMSRLNVSLDPSTPRKAVFGTTAMPLDLRYHESSGTDQEYVDYIVAVAAHKVGSIDEIWFEEKLAWTANGGATATYAGYLTVTTRTEGSAANYISINGGGKWGSSRRLTGCAYVHLRIKRTGNTKKAESPLVNGLPSRVTIIGDGARLYDPRKDSTVPGGSGSHRATDQATWGVYTDADDTDNPVLQLLWWLIGWQINGKLSVGCGVPYNRIDMASFITAANICDENVTLAIGGTQKRYRTSGTASDADDRLDIINNLLASMNGTLRDNGGKLTVTAMKNDLANYVLTFNESDMLGGFDWQQTRGLTENYNIVRGRYVDPSPNSLYQMVDYPEIELAVSDGIERVMSLDLPYVEDGRRAQRIAKQVFQRNQYRGMFSATFNAKALGCQVGNVVRINLEALGWVNKLFRVVSQEIRFDGQVPMALVEENAAIYAWDAEDVAPITPTAPTIYNPLNNPFILGLAAAEAVADGKIDSYYQASAPTGATEGDYWTDTDDANKLYRYTTGVWTLIRDTGIPAAITAAAGAQATADGKVTTFYVETTPTAQALGDLWYKPSTKYLTRWNGTAWADVATVGAKAGTNLLDSTGATLADAAIITSQGTAANITGQAATATSSDFSVITGTTKPANNATVGARAGTNIYRSDGTTVLTQAEIRTAEGTAAAITGQAATATSSDFSVVTGTTKPENNATIGAVAGTNLKSSTGTVLGDAAVITSQGTAALIANQGPGATAAANDVLNNRVENGVVYIGSPVGGSYSYTSGLVIGAIKIVLPVYRSNTMMRFFLDIYDYNQGIQTATYEIGGYNYSDGSWYNVFATKSGPRGGSLPVRFGHDGVNDIIWIGDGAENWNYPNFRIRNFQGSQNNVSVAVWDDAWGLSVTNTARTNVTNSVLVPRAGDAVFGEGVLEAGTGGVIATLPNFKTAQGTAAAIAGQAATATSSDFSVVTGTTKPANNATVGARAGTNIYRSDGTTVLSQAEIRTAEGTAANITGQGPGATAVANRVLNDRYEGLVRTIAQPDGGQFYAGDGQYTGQLQIALPFGGTSDSMISFEVNIYDYETNKTVKYIIGGYQYINVTNPWWTNVSAQYYGPRGFARPVKFGSSGGLGRIWIGNVGDTWNYSIVSIKNLQVGFRGQTLAWESGWTLSLNNSDISGSVITSVTVPRAGDQVFGEGLFEVSNGAVATLPNFKTAQGTAAAIAGQGSLATRNDVTDSQLGTYLAARVAPFAGDQNYLSAGRVAWDVTGSTVQSLKPAEVGANVTETRTAAAISGQAATATSSDFSVITGTTKPANNATVGAAWGSNLTGRPVELTDGRIDTGLDTAGRNKVGINAGSNITVANEALLEGINGTQLHPNPEFQAGSGSGWGVYNNAGGSRVSIAVAYESGIPNGTDYRLAVTVDAASVENSDPTPGWGGVHCSLTDAGVGAHSRPNKYARGTFIYHKIRAKIPVGRTINWASNSTGNEAYTEFLTTQDGTGDWKLYVMRQYIGRTGTFSSTGFFYIAGGASGGFTWYIAKWDQIDLTGSPVSFLGNGGLYDTDGNPLLNNTVITSLGTAAAIAGQAATATSSDFSAVTGTTKPSDNATSDIKLVGTGTGILITGNRVTRPTGGGSWDSQAYTPYGYVGGAFCSFSPTSTSAYFMAGLNTDPTADASYGSLDFAFYMAGDTNLYIYESGSGQGAFSTTTADDVLSVVYDNEYVRYLKNGIELRSVYVGAGKKYHFDSSFVYSGLNNIRFGPYAAANSPVSFTQNAGISAEGNTLFKRDNGGAGWTKAVSTETSIGTAFVSGRLATQSTFIGLHQVGNTATDYSSLSASWHRSVNGNWYSYMGYGGTGQGTGYTDGTKFMVTYDGANFRWYADGTLVRTEAATANLAFQAGVSIDAPNSRVSEVQFGPYTDRTWGNIAGTGRPADNAGTTLKLLALGSVTPTIIGNRASKATGGAFDCAVVNLQAFKGTAFASCECGPNIEYSMPTLDDNLTNYIRDTGTGCKAYVQYRGSTGGYEIYLGGVLQISATTTANVTGTVSVIYDGLTFNFYLNQTLLGSYATTAGQTLYAKWIIFDSSSPQVGMQAGFATDRAWSQLGGTGKPENNADVTLTAQITTQSPDDVIINADYLGAIIAGQFNKITTPIVTKAGSSVRTDNRATYTATNITGGLTGYVTMNNTTGSADKGRATITNCTSSGSYNHNIFWDGVLIVSYLVKFTVVAADPPLGGGGSGGTGNKSGSFDSTGFTVSSTSFAVVGTITNLTKAAGETIRCSFPSAEYQVNATTTVTRSIVAKWQYSATGANSWTDVGTAVTGTASSWDSVDVSGSPGSITVNQNVAPANAAYDLRLVAAMNTSGNSITFQFGTASVLIGV